MFPLNHRWERCLEIADASRQVLLTSETDEIFSAHYTATHTVPHTVESFWSGHFLPAAESLAEAEVSCNLTLCGCYKQAMAGLRSVLELGLLSVYWNVGDDGHIVIKRWLHSREDTPRPKEMWAKLSTHPGIARFCESYGIIGRIRNLFSELSNFVHARGRLYSNDHWQTGQEFKIPQPFSEQRITQWLQTYREIVWIILGLHLAKYPIATIRYDWNRKFGINVPLASVLQETDIDRAERFLGTDAFALLQELACLDASTFEFMEWIESKSDVTDDDIEQQIRNGNKEEIVGMGFEAWEIATRKFYEGAFPEGIPEVAEQRIRDLRKWARENGYLNSPDWILDLQRAQSDKEARR